MKWSTVLCICLLFPAAASASSFRAVYDSGGGSAIAKTGQKIRLYIGSHQIRIVDEQASRAQVRPAEPTRSSTVVGIGAFGIGICSRATISRNAANKHSITFGVSVVKPQLPGVNFELFWHRLPEGTSAASAVSQSNSNQTKKQSAAEQMEHSLCPSPA